MSTLTGFMLAIFTVLEETTGSILVVGGLLVLYAAITLTLHQMENHGRGRTLQSRVQRRLAMLLVGPIAPCGCWDEAGSDVVESDQFVERDTDGSLAVLRARRRDLHRCHSCGRHYHTERPEKMRHVGDESALIAYEARDRLHGFAREIHYWPEDEPDVREHISEPIEEESR